MLIFCGGETFAFPAPSDQGSCHSFVQLIKDSMESAWCYKIERQGCRPCRCAVCQYHSKGKLDGATCFTALAEIQPDIFYLISPVSCFLISLTCS